MRELFRKASWLIAVAFLVAALPYPEARAADASKIDDQLHAELQQDPAGLYYDVIIAFESQSQVSRLSVFGRELKSYRVLPMGRTLLTREEIGTVSDWSEVLSITPSRRLKLMNAEGRQLTRAEEIQQTLGLKGSGVTVAVIDTGADATHPDLANVAKNWMVAGPILTENQRIYVTTNPNGGSQLQTDIVDVSTARTGVAWNTDEYGHGTHCIGTIAGTGAASGGAQRGMAPEATIHSYSTSAAITLPFVIEAYDHLIAMVQSGQADIRVVSNSWGTEGCAFDPADPVNVATWMAYKLGVLSVFAYGNSGPGANTCNPYTSAPYVLGVGATNKAYGLTGFSSRGIPNAHYDRETALANVTEFMALSSEQRKSWDFAARPLGIFRPGVVAPGEDIVSAQNPAHPMTASGTLYGAASGTSMATPHVSGLAALIHQASDVYRNTRLSPIEVIRLLEVTANKGVMSGFDTFEVGAGFADVRAAIDRVLANNIPAQVTSADLVRVVPVPTTVLSGTYSGTAALNSWETHQGYGVHAVEVLPGALTLRVDASWASATEKLYVSLYAPGVDPSTAERHSSSAALVEDTNYRFLEVKFPQPGLWHVRVDGRINLGSTSYTGEWKVAYPQQ